MGVEPKIGGKPPKRMVKIMEIPIEMDDLGGKPPIFETIHIMLVCSTFWEKNFLISPPQAFIQVFDP